MPIQLDYSTRLPEQLAAFIRKARAVIGDGPPDAIFSLEDDFSCLLEDRDLWSGLLNNQLEKILANDLEEGSGAWLENSLILHYTQDFSFALRVERIAETWAPTPKKNKYLTSSASNLLLGFLHQTPTKVRHYSFPDGCNLDEFSYNTRLSFIKEETVRPRQCLRLNAVEEVIDFDLPQFGIALALAGSPYISQVWTFDSSELNALGATISSEYTSVIIQMLDEIERQRLIEARDAVHSLTQHIDHHVRWKAIKCLSKLDPQAIRGRLLEALSDCHPFVRDAARKTLSSIA